MPDGNARASHPAALPTLNYCVNHFSCICAYSGDAFILSSAALIYCNSASLPLRTAMPNPFP